MDNFTISDLTVFVSIASYRDPECKSTLEDLFQKAKHPNRIFLGICQQNNFDTPSENCISSEEQPYSKNIRILTLPYQEAKGPTYARYLCSTLYKNEDFFLQIDAHSKFVQNWDHLLLEMYFLLKHTHNMTKIILSTYPGSMEDYTSYPSHKTVPHIDSAYQKNGIIRYHTSNYRKTSVLPKPNLFIAAGFLFTTGSWLKDVPFDPTLDYLFIGEEILLSARSYTKGWEIFIPNKEIIFHHYLRHDENKIWEDKTYSAKNAEHRLKNLLSLDSKLNAIAKNDTYGIGNVREVKDYLEKIGIVKPASSENYISQKKHHDEQKTPIQTNSGAKATFSTLFVILILMFFLMIWSIAYNFHYINK